jgi:hypothetical protein
MASTGRGIGSLRRFSLVRLLLLAGMGYLVAVNLMEFSTVEARSCSFFSAFHHRENGDIVAVMWDEDASSSSRYSPFLALGFVAPGSTALIAERDSGSEEWFHERLYAFGGVKDVEEVEGSALDLLGDVDFEPYVVASGLGGVRGDPWAIAIVGGDSWEDPAWYFLRDAFASPDQIHGEARTFLVVAWSADPEDGDDRQWLFIDVGLLPWSEGVGDDR